VFLLALSSVVQGNWAFIEFVENSAVYFDGSMRKYDYIAQAMNFQAGKGSIDISSTADLACLATSCWTVRHKSWPGHRTDCAKAAAALETLEDDGKIVQSTMFVSFNAPRQIGDRRVAVPISDARGATEIAGRPTRSAGETRSVLRSLVANQAVKNPWRRNSRRMACGARTDTRSRKGRRSSNASNRERDVLL